MPPSPERLPVARHVLAVGSGKGGVGKSTVSLNLALALAARGRSVGLLDADIYGPNIPLMVGLVREKWSGAPLPPSAPAAERVFRAMGGGDWTLAQAGRAAGARIPPIERFGLKIMSAGFIVGEDQPLADSGLLRLLAAQFMWQVDWGDLDYLLVDLPPGTGDAQQIFARAARFAGAVLVVTPQDVAHLDAKKAVQMYRREGVPILGGVENMSGFICPDCGARHDLFARVPEARSLWAMGVPKLGDIPLDPTISRAGDTGRPFFISHPDSPQTAAFRGIAERLDQGLNP
jgi:ATP-binding protein involved in chromosome partitioning